MDQEGVHARSVRRPHPLRHHGDQQRQYAAVDRRSPSGTQRRSSPVQARAAPSSSLRPLPTCRNGSARRRRRQISSCTLAPELLPPGASHFVDVTIDTGRSARRRQSRLPQLRELGAPWYGEACADGGTNLVIIKTAPAACAPGADCTFGVTITNTGSLPFSGDVVLERQHVHGAGCTDAGSDYGIVPPLGCAAGARRVPFSCVAPLTLAPGESTGVRHHGDDACRARRRDTGRTIASRSRPPAFRRRRFRRRRACG